MYPLYPLYPFCGSSTLLLDKKGYMEDPRAPQKDTKDTTSQKDTKDTRDTRHFDILTESPQNSPKHNHLDQQPSNATQTPRPNEQTFLGPLRQLRVCYTPYPLDHQIKRQKHPRYQSPRPDLWLPPAGWKYALLWSYCCFTAGSLLDHCWITAGSNSYLEKAKPPNSKQVKTT
jgi:hypothetical protein